MAKLFSVVSWNIEHFRGKNPKRIDSILKTIADINPDIFALYEVEGKHVYNYLTDNMPNYSFHITEGPQIQEILVGVKQKFPAFFTQKIEFKSGKKFLRPGAVLSVKKNNDDYTFLFLHTKSGTDPIGLGLRDDMFKRACKLRKILDKKYNKKWQSNYVFMGDLNTMGMKYPYDRHIHSETEIKKLGDYEAKKVKMRILKKDEPATWWNGSKSRYKPVDLDQVVAADHLKFKKFSNAEIQVLGWPKAKNTTKADQWISNYSDHGIIYFEILN